MMKTQMKKIPKSLRIPLLMIKRKHSIKYNNQLIISKELSQYLKNPIKELTLKITIIIIKKLINLYKILIMIKFQYNLNRINKLIKKKIKKRILLLMIRRKKNLFRMRFKLLILHKRMGFRMILNFLFRTKQKIKSKILCSLLLSKNF